MSMIELDSPMWAELSHAYGNAAQGTAAPRTWDVETGFSDYEAVDDIPRLLRQLEADPQVGLSGDTDDAEDPEDAQAEPWYTLWSALCHQGDVYTASYAAVPHIVRIAFTVEGLPSLDYFLLPCMIEIARATGHGPEIPPNLSDAYLEALQRLHDLAHKIAPLEWNEGMSRVIAATLLAIKGHAVLAETVMELSPDVLRDARVAIGVEGEEDDEE